MADIEIVDGKSLFHNRIENGWGSVHINRFRIHFLAENMCLLPTFPRRILESFEHVFSGTAPNTTKNIATARKYRGEQGGEYIQFDLKLDLDLDQLAGQFRDDWVKVGWKDDTRGFAVDTMAYKISFLKGLLGPFVAGPPVRFHFLCGRRSWIMFKLREWVDTDMPSRKNLAPSRLPVCTDREHIMQKDEIYVLETAAIERFSGPSIMLRNWMSNGIRDMIVKIWSTLLENFVKFYNFRVICPLDDYTFPKYQFEQKRIGSVYYQLDEFETASDCRSNNVTFQIRKWHPYLESINLEYDQFRED